MMKVPPPEYFFFFSPAPYFKSTCKSGWPQSQGKDVPPGVHSATLLIDRGFVLRETLGLTSKVNVKKCGPGLASCAQ